MPRDFHIRGRELDDMEVSVCGDSLEEGHIEVRRVVLSCFLLHVNGLRSQVGDLLFNFNGVDSVEFLDLTLLFVKIHNDGLVVSLAEASDEVVVLGHDDAVDR